MTRARISNISLARADARRLDASPDSSLILNPPNLLEETMAPKIDFVVVLMLENRSFDHIFGFFPGANGLKGTEFNLLKPFDPPSDANPKFNVGEGANFAIARGLGPGHSLKATNIQLSGVPTGPDAAHPVALNGFVASYTGNLKGDHVSKPTPEELGQPLKSFSKEQLPSLNALAREFVLCDNWFCEVPGPTQPNRLFVHAATSEGFAFNDWSRTIGVDSIYNRLEAAKRTWAVYYSDDNDVVKFNRVTAKAYTKPAEEAEFESDRKAGVLGAFLDFKTFFKQHVASGKLSTYNFIEPAFGDSKATKTMIDSMHAPHDVRPGDLLVADVYEALRSSPDVWKRTLLVVTFDEHGGFYDHVAPPQAANPDGRNQAENPKHGVPAFAFDRLGLRVPAILVSPWLPKGKVVHTQYQHTSVLATLRKLFNLGQPLTKRDAAARPFDDLLSKSMRQNPLQKLPRVQMPPPAAAKARAEVAHPAKLDTLLQEKAEGWRKLLAKTVGTKVPKPSTTEDAHVVMRDAVKEYARWRFEQVRGKK